MHVKININVYYITYRNFENAIVKRYMKIDSTFVGSFSSVVRSRYSAL